jgi:hypothetical protein
MQCPLCDSRKGRRACPALNKDICAVCCGTKRMAEIACPSTCAYLAAAREHPAAVVRRQQERDVAALMPIVGTLTERQHQLVMLFHTVVISRHKPEGFARLIDDDVAEAAGSLAATLETASRGVIYEHTASTAIAQHLVRDLTALLADMRQRGARVSDREAAVALRAIEKGAREVRNAVEGGDTAYLTLMARIGQQGPPQSEPQPPQHQQAPSRLILP